MKWVVAIWAFVMLVIATSALVLTVSSADEPSLVEKINTACPPKYQPESWSVGVEGGPGIPGVISVDCLGPRDAEGFYQSKTVAVER